MGPVRGKMRAEANVGRLRRWGLVAASEVAWRLPGWPRRFYASFRDSEAGSAVDMLAACELTSRRDLRRKYFRHALDETRHAGIFQARAEANGGGRDRARAALVDAGTLQRHGIVEGRTMFERLGELEFLAFVHVAENDAVEQFNVYRDRRLPDPESWEALGHILKDEHFHVSYSRQELDRWRKEGRGGEVDAALSRVRWRRLKEAWLRFSRGVGLVMGSAWLLAVYAVIVAPFRLVARLDRGGWQAPAADPRPLAVAARSQG